MRGNTLNEKETDAAGFNLPVPMARFMEITGLSPVSIWRFEKRGWLKTIRIAGRKYLTPEALREFNARAAAGEFAGPDRAKNLLSRPGGARA